MATYLYHCTYCKDTFEEMWRAPDDCIWPCPVCGTAAKRVACSGVPAIRGETVGSSFSSSRAVDSKGRYRLSDFQEASEEVAHTHTRAERREGRSLKGPDLYKAGLNRARQMGAKVRRK